MQKKQEKKYIKIPLTSYGLWQVAVYPAVLLSFGVVLYLLWPGGRWWVQIAAVVLTAGILAFFRDPHRQVPAGDNLLLAPADGKITEILDVQQCDFIDGPAVRIGIFLSVLDVHINRSPCAGRVDYVQARPGKCLNAMRSEAASIENQSNSLGLHCPDHPAGKVLVKQITGAIARRIVCRCGAGENLAQGQRFGMIKFGSRTELFFPKNERAQIQVKPGQTVRAGNTIMVRYA